MRQSLLLLCLFTWVSVSVNAQTVNWPTFEEVEIPDSLSNEKAIYIKNVSTFDFNNVGQTDLNVFKRIFILDDEGAEDLTTLVFYLNENTDLLRIAGRIIKENGKIIDLSGTDKFKNFEMVRDAYSNRKKRKYTVNYPNLDPGDVIDLMYDVKMNYYLFSQSIYLEDIYPSLYSRVSLRNYSLMDITAYAMNSSIQPVTKLDKGSYISNWERVGVPKKLSNYFNAPTPNSPCLIYNLWTRESNLDYAAVYSYDFNEYPHTFTSLQSIDEYFSKQGLYGLDEMLEIKIQKIIAYFEREYTFVNNLPLEPAAKVFGHLHDKKINEKMFFIVMQRLLQEHNTKLFVAYSQSLLDGPFFHGIVSLSQLSRRFIYFENSEGQSHFLFGPSDHERYLYLDEVPHYLEDNQSILMTGKKGTLEDLVKFQLPKSTKQDNTHFVKVLIKEDQGKHTIRRDDHLSGHYSLLTRGLGQKTWSKKFAIAKLEYDHSLQKPTYPYDLDIVDNSCEQIKFKVNSDTTFFDLKNVLTFSLFEENEDDEPMGKYLILPFEKSVKYSIYYQAEKAISILAQDELKISNSAGEITCKVAQMGDNMFSILITLSLNDRYLDTKEKIENYQQLLAKWNVMRDKTFAFKQN
jgi:hypothetical protein